ncbi:Flp pilus assembly complex ATPase component TadA [Lachnospiraceae bacterium PAL113]|uniref:Flp pilus assembly complex ATPase component TadA n=1 Tax=Aequitasia blattaphilus TaxID=2949332 RepID=A0ABT1E7W6_9FIRM|nr:Flp pilus assembly complex ATPase component TadA [Aequitasia blattaphilus]MCR8614558.1 Flp pilus assembly complex ATPase component TadA [Aequitasia blattaphilus]
MKNIPIGELLKESGYITEEQIQKALAYQKENRGKRLGAILIELGFVTERQTLEALAKRFDLPIVDLGNYEVDIEAVAKIPKQLAEKYHMLAIKQDEQSLTVATNDPLDFYGFEDVKQVTGMDLETVLSEKGVLQGAINYFYSEVSAKRAAQKANTTSVEIDEIDLDINEEDGDAPIVNLLNSLVARGYSVNASDIHVEPFETQSNIRMRIDGTIVDYVTLQKSLHASLIARIKIISDLDIAERRIPQDGHFKTKIGDTYVNVRVSVIPTVFGEKAVLRLLASRGSIDYPATYGMLDEDYEKFSSMLQSPNGILYLTGPTGSGKTTTLYMVLEELSKRQVNISTIEDPVEKNLPKINQMQTNNMAGLTFEVGLRALLRQDPDIIMVGETRDSETAAISIRAAITGHLVLSTLHTNNAAATVVRLIDMGMEPYMIASSLVGVVAQRLMRKVCKHCGTQRPVSQRERAFLRDEIQVVQEAHGCTRCNNTGYSGRIAIHEILMIDEQVRKMITAGSSVEEIVEYGIREQGMYTLASRAEQLVAEGVTTVEELLKIAYYS